jgi:hypothetical protein
MTVKMVLTSPEHGSTSRLNSPTTLNHTSNNHNDDYIRVTLNVSGTPSRSRLPPQRGTTLPQLISSTMPELQSEQRTTRANTLPSSVPYDSSSQQELNNYINNNHHRGSSDQPMVSRNALTAVSILSLPTSDNEAQFNFEHR